jgi:hypothetical protein
VSANAPFSHDDVEQRLLTILTMVNDWLKFAEAKNAGVIGLGSAGVAVLASFISSEDDSILTTGLGIAASLVTFSVLAGLVSFSPRTSLGYHLKTTIGKPEADDNLYYYGHLAKYNPTEIVEVVANDYANVAITDVVHARSRNDLAAQIIVNSRITLTKLQLFSVATRLFACAAIVSIVTVLVSVIV